jgi:hypothetical protein
MKPKAKTFSKLEILVFILISSVIFFGVYLFTSTSEFVVNQEVGESVGWVKTNVSPEVWYDQSTGLYWSGTQAVELTNLFDEKNCGFFSSSNRGDYQGGDVKCGEAINLCAELSLDANGDGEENTNWYLPNRKEYMQAYVNGISEETDKEWLDTLYFWSSTGNQNCERLAWNMYLFYGYNNFLGKDKAYGVRCVLRGL